MSSYNPRGISGVKWTKFNNVQFDEIVRDYERTPVARATVTLDSTVTDSGNTPTTTLRRGWVLGMKDSDERAYLWGANFADITGETASGTGSKTVFDLAQDNIVPGSLTVTVGTTAQGREAYEVNHKAGRVTLITAPATGTDNVTFAYTHMGTLDGTEDIIGILPYEVDLLDADGSAQDVEVDIIQRADLLSSNLRFTNSNAATYGKHLLAFKYGCTGDWELSPIPSVDEL